MAPRSRLVGGSARALLAALCLLGLTTATAGPVLAAPSSVRPLHPAKHAVHRPADRMPVVPPRAEQDAVLATAPPVPTLRRATLDVRTGAVHAPSSGAPTSARAPPSDRL